MDEPRNQKLADSEIHISSPGGPPQPIVHVIEVLRQLTDGDGFRQAEIITHQLKSLKAAITKHDAEVREIDTRCHYSVEQILRSHHDDLAKARQEQKDFDSEQIRSEVRKFEEERRKSQESEANLTQTKREVETLLQMVKEKEDQTQRDKELLEAQAETLSTQRTALEAATKEQADLNKDLAASKLELSKILDFAPRLIDDQVDEVSTQFSDLWKRCFKLVESWFQADLTEDVLQTKSVWRDLQRCHQVTHQVPLIPSNSSAAKHSRALVVLAIISEAMVREIFTTTALVEGDEDFRDVLYNLSAENAPKEAFLRNLLASLQDSVASNAHVQKVVKHVHGLVRDMLEPGLSHSLRNDLTAVITDAARAWKTTQRRRSRFEIDMQWKEEPTWKWMSISQQGSPLRLTEREVSAGDFAANEVELVVLPRVYTVGRERDTLIVPGRVLQKAEAGAMRKMMVQNRPSHTRERISVVKGVHFRGANPDPKISNNLQGNTDHFLDSNAG